MTRNLIKIGVMGSARTVESTRADVEALAGRLGKAIAKSGGVLITGATTGIPDIVTRAASEEGGVTLGFSPASNRTEHASVYGLPDDGEAIILYTGFGLKGRNVLNVRASDIVIIVGGSTGALNEFTIAFDEDKVIGVLEGSGGIADELRNILKTIDTRSTSVVIFGSDPDELIADCIAAYSKRGSP